MPIRSSHTTRHLDDLAGVHPHAAGLDIGSAAIVAAIPAHRDEQPVRVVGTCSPDVHTLRDWLISCGIATVAMESTDVVWIPIYEVLEAAGITCFLVNARHVKTVPGRTTDWNDAQWLQKLHALGLLQASFRPDAEIRSLRTLVRSRAELVERRAPHINHRIQARTHMHSQLSLVVRDSTGVTGLAMVRAMVAGARDPPQRARFRQPGCTHAEADSITALTGSWDDVQVCVREQALDVFDDSTTTLGACDHRWAQQY